MAGDEWRVHKRGIGYRRLPSQRKFHASRARFKGYSGPVGSGKTHALCQEAIRLQYENTGRTGLIGAPTYPMLRDATLVTFFDICEQNAIPYRFNKATNTVTMTESGSRILFRSLDEFERLRGPNLAWFGVDEMTYTAEQAWVRLEARLRDPKAKMLCGFGVWTPKGFDWVARRFRSEPVKGYRLIEAKPFENRHILKQVPDYYERLKASYDPNFYEQEVLGKYLNLNAGQVYYAFDRAANTGHFLLDPDDELLWSWDFNINPMCSVVCQKVNDVMYVVDEIVLETSSTPEVLQEFLARYEDHRGGVRIFGDASGRNAHTATGTSDYDIIREFFARRRELNGSVDVSAANPPVRDRVNGTNAYLKNAKGERRLFVDLKCRQVIKDLEEVCYKPNSSQIDKDRDPKRTHLSDALGYLLWHEFRRQRRVGERSQRIM